jgi:hypothetical protein
MKKLSSLLAIGALLVAGAANAAPLSPPAYAVLSTGAWSDGNGGGEFTATIYNGNGTVAETYQTFCLQYSEHFSPGTHYTYSITPATNLGNTISIGTEALYAAFFDGTLTGYRFGGTNAERLADATELQLAFWALEGQSAAPAPSANNKFLALLGDLTAAKEDYVGTEVAVLNLGTNQDQLYRHVPDGGATIAMLGLALLGLGFIRRRLV